MAKPTLFVPTLKTKERKRIENHLRRARETRYADRLRTVLWSEQRQSVSAIAALLHKHPTTVLLWLKDYLRFGLRGLTLGKSTGAPRKVDADADACLQEALARNPRDLGYRFNRWTLDTLAEHVRREVHVCVHPFTISRAVHRLGYSYVRPKYCLRHRQKRRDVRRARCERDAALKKVAAIQSAMFSFSKTSASSISIPA
jgi:transposase